MRRPLAVMVAALLLTGCVSAPSTVPQEHALASAKLGLDAAPAPATPDHWWTAFGDPQLNDFVDRSLAANPSLAAALARMREVEAEYSANRALSYPQITLDAQEERERFSDKDVIPPPFGGSTQWSGSAQVNLSWSIDFWGRQAAAIEKARSSAVAAALDAAAARLALAGAVTDAYLALAHAYSLCDLAAQAAAERNAVFALTRTRVRAGLENLESQKSAEALLAQAEQDRTRAYGDRDIIVHQLAALSGEGANAYAAIVRPSLNLDAVLVLPHNLPADLLARRPNILAARARIDAALSGREVARTAFYPNVNLLAFAGTAALGLGSLFTADALTYGGGAALHLPIFDAGKLRADYAGATATLDAAVADYNDAVLSAVRQTADALTQLRADEDQRAQQQRALAAAQASFSLAETRYRTGLDPHLNLLTAQNTLIDARRQQADLDADAASRRVALLLAIGGGFDPASVQSAQNGVLQPPRGVAHD